MDVLGQCISFEQPYQLEVLGVIDQYGAVVDCLGYQLAVGAESKCCDSSWTGSKRPTEEQGVFELDGLEVCSLQLLDFTAAHDCDPGLVELQQYCITILVALSHEISVFRSLSGTHHRICTCCSQLVNHYGLRLLRHLRRLDLVSWQKHCGIMLSSCLPSIIANILSRIKVLF
jgi:hypothetical protein